jgi:hypothetical protein
MWVVIVAVKEATVHLRFVVQERGSNYWEEFVESHVYPMCACVLVGLMIHIAGLYYQPYQALPTQWTTRRTIPNMDVVLVKAGMVAIAAYALLGCWSPVIHCCLSLVGQFFFSADGADIAKKVATVTGTGTLAGQQVLQQKAQTAPNVIFIVMDSLSGSLVANSEKGKNATPFFHSLLKGGDDMYHFRHARTVSGETQGGTTGMMSGCIPFTKQGREMAFSRSIGTEFKKMGRQTAAFSTSRLDYEDDQWFMTTHYLTANMDHVVTPISAGHELVNVGGSDDRWFLPHLKDWIQHNVTTSTTSFFAQLYWFNTHFPYLRDPGTKFAQRKHRLYSSLETFDDTLKQLFEMLRETGQLNNTIIVASSDHGESTKKKFARVSMLEPHVLHALTFMHVPKHLFSSVTEQRILRENVNQVVSILDLFPTLQHILYGGNVAATLKDRVATGAASTSSDQEQRHCFTGLDLLDQVVPDDRVALSWNVVTEPESKQLLAAVSNTERALYLRRGYARRNGLFQMTYDACTIQGLASDCTEEATPADRIFWQGVVRGMHNSSTVNKHVLDSIFMKEIKKYLKMN